MICRTVKIIPDYQYFLVFSKMLLMQKIFITKIVHFAKKRFGLFRLVFESLKARLGSLGKKLGSARQKVGSDTTLLSTVTVVLIGK